MKTREEMHADVIASLHADVVAYAADLSRKIGVDIDAEEMWEEVQSRINSWPDGTPGPAREGAP